jgi:hypothetical protein
MIPNSLSHLRMLSSPPDRSYQLRPQRKEIIP